MKFSKYFYVITKERNTMNFLISLFKTIRILVAAVSFYIVLLDFLYLRYLLKEKRRGKPFTEYMGVFFSRKSVIVLCQVILILGVLFSRPIYSRFENTDIGSFFEKESYCEQYYVYLRNDSTKQKSYRLKADIIRSDYGYPSYVDGEESFVVQGNGYFILKAYWGNGGYLTFVDENEFEMIGYPNKSARIFPGVETKVQDYKGDIYYITLTDEKVKR